MFVITIENRGQLPLLDMDTDRENAQTKVARYDLKTDAALKVEHYDFLVHH